MGGKREAGKQCLFSGSASCDMMVYGCMANRLGAKGRPALNSSPPRCASSLPPGSRAPAQLLRAQEDSRRLFLVEVGKLALSPLLVSTLDCVHVLLDSKSLCVGELVLGPISWRRPSFSLGLCAGCPGLRQSQQGWSSHRLMEVGMGSASLRLCCIHRETFRICECKWLLERNLPFLLVLRKSKATGGYQMFCVI